MSLDFKEILESPTIILDRTKFSPSFVPDELPFREREIEKIMRAIAPLLKQQRGTNVILYGKTGTGKTSSVVYVKRKFEEMNIPHAKMVYLNCRIYNTPYRIFERLMKEFMGSSYKLGFGLPFFYEKLLELLNRGYFIAVVLDEIDAVRDVDELVYSLTRINDESKKGCINVIAISNKLEFKQRLDPRTRSSLHEIEVIFSPYNARELKEILLQRARLALKPGSWEESALELAGVIASMENGDARYALKLLEKAAQLAEQERAEKITHNHVERARKEVEINLLEETLNTLPESHQILLYSIFHAILYGKKMKSIVGEEGMITTGEAYHAYEQVCKKLMKKPKSMRWIREYISELESLGLLITIKSGKGMRGQTTLIRSGHSMPEELYKIVRAKLKAIYCDLLD